MACTVCLLNKSISTNIIRTASNQQCNISKLGVFFILNLYFFLTYLTIILSETMTPFGALISTFILLTGTLIISCK